MVGSAQLTADDYWFTVDDQIGGSQLDSILDASLDDKALGKLSLDNNPSDALRNVSSGIQKSAAMYFARHHQK